MKLQLFSILLFIILCAQNSYLFSQNNDQSLLSKCYDLYNKKISSGKIISYIEKSSKSIDQHKLEPIYDSLILCACKDANYDYCLDLTLAKVRNGYLHIMVLEDSIANVIKSWSPEKYKMLERVVNEEFIRNSQKYNPDINLELAFTIRHLYRLDQRTKLRIFYKANEPILDSLRKIAIKQDSITEAMLGQIFDEYGYPGISLVGGIDAGSCYIMMLHVSADFAIKYMRLVQEAINSKELYADLDFLVDKTLHKCCQRTIYGTLWSKYSPLVTDPEEIKKIKALLNIQ
ncbi:MAG: hypothetical protein J0G96_10840 [Flavobacteriia bacterium]|nr:hypothetical protein [Flavobacteriia bacterium]OJX34941.1 MAG: hypothetical protein BGO87_09375 [Flavobacteriia bacterium 40-80]